MGISGSRLCSRSEQLQPCPLSTGSRPMEICPGGSRRADPTTMTAVRRETTTAGGCAPPAPGAVQGTPGQLDQAGSPQPPWEHGRLGCDDALDRVSSLTFPHCLHQFVAYTVRDQSTEGWSQSDRRGGQSPFEQPAGITRSPLQRFYPVWATTAAQHPDCCVQQEQTAPALRISGILAIAAAD